MNFLQRFHLKFWVILTIAVQILFYGISFVQISKLYLAITVARILPPHCWVWTLLTFSFYNTRILHLLLDAVTVYLVDIVMFPSWKLVEVVRCCALAQLLSSFLVVGNLFFGYALTFNIDWLWETEICGLSPLLGAVLVVARQLTPDIVLANLPLGKFRIKHIAFTMFLCYLTLALLRISNFVHFLLFLYGEIITWVYLRFFQRHVNGDIGDTTDAFKFSGFFPNHLEPPVAMASNAIYNLLVKLHLCRPAVVFDTTCDNPSFTLRVIPSDALNQTALTEGVNSSAIEGQVFEEPPTQHEDSTAPKPA